MSALGRKADGRLSQLHSEKPAIECARQMHQIFCIDGYPAFLPFSGRCKIREFCIIGKAIFRSWFDELSLRAIDSGESLC